MTPENCPVCGADLPAKAKACPECGACDKTGWSEAATEDPLGLEQESFNYEEFVQEEFDGKSPAEGGSSLWKWVAALLLGLFLLWFLAGTCST